MNIHDTVKALIENTVKDCVFLTKTEADNKIIDVLDILFDDGNFRFDSSVTSDNVYCGEIFYQIKGEPNFKRINFISEPVKFHDTLTNDKKFNFDIINRSLKQLSVFTDSLMIYNVFDHYTSMEKLHDDLADLNYLVKKLNSAAKYDPK